MKLIEVICFNCGKTVQKEIKEYKRRIKSGKDRFFCNLSCATFTRNKENPPIGNIDNFRGEYREKDQYTPFRWFILRAKYRDKKKKYGYDLTVEYLKQLWDEQKELCPITGWKLILPENTRNGWSIKNPMNASLDRIDNSKGYLQGNVRFISTMANMARNVFSDEELIDFCKSVVKNVS